MTNSERRSERIVESNRPWAVPVNTTLGDRETKWFSETITTKPSGDVTLRLKGDWGNTTHITSRSRPSFMSRISERRDSRADDDEAELTRYPAGTMVTRRVEISREPHDGPAAAWADERRSSPDSLELTEMQPEHSQNDGGVGLGSAHRP